MNTSVIVCKDFNLLFYADNVTQEMNYVYFLIKKKVFDVSISDN